MLNLLVYLIIFFIVPIITGILSFIAFPVSLLLELIKSPMLVRMFISGLIRGSVAFALSYYVFRIFDEEFTLFAVIVLFIALLLPAMKALSPLKKIKNEQSDDVPNSMKEVINLVDDEVNKEKTMFAGEFFGLILLSASYFL